MAAAAAQAKIAIGHRLNAVSPVKMLGLIGGRDRLGGSEPLLNVEERLKAEHPVTKQWTGA